MQNTLSRIIKYSIYALVFLLPFFWLPFSFEMFEYNKQYLLFFLVSLGFSAWIIKQVAYDKEIKFKSSPIDYLVLGFLGISLISAIFSVDRISSIFGFYGRFSNGFIGLLSLAVLYFLITNNVTASSPEKSEARNQKLEASSKFQISISRILSLFLWSNGIIIFTAYFSIFGIWQKIGSFLPLPQVMFQNIFNPAAGSMEGLAIFLAVVAVLLTGLLLNKTRIFYWILLIASLGLLVIIDFTSAWIVLLATLGLLLALSLAKRIFKDNVNRLLIPIFLVIIALANIVWQPFTTNLPKEQVLSQPISWQVAFQSATDSVKNGFLGSGLGTFYYDFAKHKPQSFNQNWMWQIRFDRAGSYFAEILGTVGFFGLMIYLGILALFLIIVWFLLSKDFAGFPWVMAFTALIISQLVYYQNTALAFAFWTVLGLSVVSWQAKSPGLMKEKKISFKNFPELSLLLTTLMIVFGVFIAILFFYGARYYLADINYSKALMTLGEPRIKSLEKAVSHNPGLSQYRIALSRAYLAEVLREMQEPQAAKNQEKIQLFVSGAINQAVAATQLQPNQVSGWETLSIAYREIRGIAQGATEWGIKSFEKAIDLEPTNPVLYTELGRMYLVIGDKEKAKDSFNKALEKKPDYSTATIQLALLLEQDNIVNEAIVKLENLIQNDLYNIEARFQLGRLYFNNNRADEAVGQFEIVVALAPNHSNAHYALGVAYAAQGKKQLAIQSFEKVLELNPGNADVMEKLKKLRGE